VGLERTYGLIPAGKSLHTQYRTDNTQRKGNEQMKEYIVTVSIEYGTNIEAESQEEAREKARLYIAEQDAGWLSDMADVTVENED